MRFGTWNVRSLYKSGTLMMVVGELARYKLDLVGVQEVDWDKAGTIRAGDYMLFYGKGNDNQQLGTGFFVHQRILPAVKKVEFVSDRMSYTAERSLV
jgi:exonuclease III